MFLCEPFGAIDTWRSTRNATLEISVGGLHNQKKKPRCVCLPLRATELVPIDRPEISLGSRPSYHACDRAYSRALSTLAQDNADACTSLKMPDSDCVEG